MRRALLAPVAATLIASAAALARSPQSPQTTAASTLIVHGDAAIVTIAVRPDRAADFDRLLEKTRAALRRSRNPQRQAQAAGWHVFKSEEMVQGNVTYLMRLDPAVGGADYSFAAIISEESRSDEAEIRNLLQDIVIGQSILSLNVVAVPGLGGRSAAMAAEASRADDGRSLVLSFETAQAVILSVLVRPDRESDFRATLNYLGRSLQGSARRQRQASGWKVWRGVEALGTNAVYVMSLDPVVARVEYDVTRLIQESFPREVDAIFQRYRDAYVGQAVSRLTARVDMSQ